MKQSENCKQHPHSPFSRRIVNLIIDYRLTAYYVTPLTMLFFRDKMENVIKRFHCICHMSPNKNNVNLYTFIFFNHDIAVSLKQ